MGESAAAVRVRGATKAFGRSAVLRGVDLDLAWGETLCLMGANGSGKTTLLKIVATIAKPDAGEVFVGGVDVRRNGARARRLIGAALHDPLLYDDLTARENMRFFCRMYGLDDPDGRAERASALMGMSEHLDRRASAMSHGMKKRFGIARALLHDPAVLLLDEPETGLDADAVALLDRAIAGGDDVGNRNGNGGGAARAVIMTTHDRDRARRLGDKVATLSNGRLAMAEREREHEGERGGVAE